MGKKPNIGRKTKAAQHKKVVRSQQTTCHLKEKHQGINDKKIKDAAKKFFDQIPKTSVCSTCIDEIPYCDRIAGIEKYISIRKHREGFTLEDFVQERYDILLNWCYICHRTLFSKQAEILKKSTIKPNIPNEHKDQMPDKMIVCHRCKHVLTETQKIPAQSFWNDLDPGKIPDVLSCLTPMETRLIQRMVPFMKIVKFKGFFGQYGLHGQAVLFARDVCEILDILPRKPNQMDMIMVIESLKNIDKQRETMMRPEKVKNALDYLLEFNDRYKDVQIDTNALEIDYSQFFVVPPPVIEKEKKIDEWTTLNFPGVSSTNIINILRCKRHEFSDTFIIEEGNQSLPMCLSALVKQYFREFSTWDSMDLDMVLEQGHSLFIECKKDICGEAITFNSIKKCFLLHNRSIEVAFIKQKTFKRNNINEFVLQCLENDGRGIMYSDNVFISIAKEDEKYYLFDSRPHGKKGGACTKITKNNSNASAIVMSFNNFQEFIKRLEKHFNAKTTTEYTIVSVIVSETETEELDTTFGDLTPSLHTNPIFKEPTETQSPLKNVGPTTNDTSDNLLSQLTDQLSLNDLIITTTYASRNQADIRYKRHAGMQCTAMACAAIVKSYLTPLEDWKTNTMDDVLDAGNAIYIETCDKVKQLRYIGACEIVEKTYQFNQHINLKIIWRPHGIAIDLKKNIKEFFEINKYGKGILTCEDYSYAIIFENDRYWFFDSHSNPPHSTSILHQTNLNGLMEILNSKIINQMSQFDISSVEASFGHDYRQINIESRSDYVGQAKHELSDTSRPNEILKKPKIELNISSKMDYQNDCCKTPKKINTHNYVEDFDLIIDENEGMTPYRQIYDARNIEKNNEMCCFYVTPWKNDEQISLKQENYKRRLELFEQDDSETVDPIIYEEENLQISPEEQISYVNTANYSEKYRSLAQLNGFDVIACIVAAFNLNIDSFTGWSAKRLQNVLDEAENMLPLFRLEDKSAVAFGQTFHFETFLFGKTLPPELNTLIQSFFTAHDFGLLRYNGREYLISFLNDFYSFFDPHSCNSNGYPTESGTSCIIVTKNFDALIRAIEDRLTYNDKALRTLLENKEVFTLHAMQIEAINDTNIVQKDLKYENVTGALLIKSSTNHQFFQETEHLCAAVAALATNFINSFNIWDTQFMNSIMQDAVQIYRNLKHKAQVDIQTSFKMFSLSDISLQTSINEEKIDESSLSNTLKTHFKSYDSAVISVNNKFFTIMSNNENYCLFDSHGNEPEGYPRITRSVIVKSLSQLEDVILSRCHGNENLKIKLYRMDVTKINNLDFEIDPNDRNEPQMPEVEVIDTELFNIPIDCPISLMRPIEQTVPRTEEMYDVNINNKDCNSENIPIISITRATKPPLSHILNPRFEEYCFPVLFPKGINGFKQERELKMTALDYFQSRIMGKDTRFHSNEYLLFALNFVEYTKVTSGISLAAKMKQNHQDIKNVASQLHLVMRTIRGTSAYWGNALLDLLAMVKVLGPGTAFLTLSCNDLNWDFMLKACLQAEGRGNVDPSKLTKAERQHLIENNPVMVSRLFNREVQNMIKLLRNGQALSTDEKIWKVSDYWYRIEWQQRGSPHCHMIIWIEDFPELESPEGIKAMESICRCDIPDDDEELANLVKGLQRHHCTDTCERKKNTKKKSSNEKDTELGTKEKTCRFGFPRRACKETKVLDPETTEFIRNGHRLVQMKRNENARYINNYNPNILRVWKANMDIQFITSQAIVAYVAKYSCKAEPNTLHKLINEAIKEAENKNEETRKTLFKVTMKLLNERQISCCEAATRLCHLQMKGSSRKVVFINSSRPEERYRLLNVESSNPENNSYFSNIIDRYQLRPDDMGHMSLAEFAMEYQPHYVRKNNDIVDEEDGDVEFNDEEENTNPKKNPNIILLKDGKSYIKKRANPAVFRSRYFSLSDNRSNYFYALLLLHLPFRSETQLLQKLRENDNDPIETYSYEETDKAFFDKKHLLRPFSNTCTLDAYLKTAFELQDAIRQMEVLMNGSNNSDENEDEQNRTLHDDVRDVDNQNNLPNLPSADLLNSDQRKVYTLVQEWIKCHHENEERRKKGEETNVNEENAKLNQLIMFITGSAGTGKSFLIQQIVKIVKDYFEPKHPNSRVIFVTAPTGIAAKQINGQTLHAALALGIELGEVSKYKALTGNFLKQKREIWKNVKFLIIDEISMVSYEMLKNIDLRLKELLCNDLPFGGLCVLAFGDLMQLPPVLGHYVYERPHYTSEFHLWRLFDFCELKQNMRQKSDQPFIELLNAMRIGVLTSKHRQMLHQRVEDEHLKREGIFDDMRATLITPLNITVKEHNSICLNKLISQNFENEKEKYQRNRKYQGYYLIRAIDELQIKTNNPNWEKFIPTDDNKCAGVPKELKLAIGARVMLRRNLDVSRGLVNGALGVIKCFNWGGCFLKDQSEPGNLPESVTVTFDGIGDTIIKPQRCEFNANGGLGKVDRLQIPLILAWGITSHKLQGVTVESAVLDMGSSIFAKGQGYVMLSRAKRLENVLILRPLDLTKFEKKYINSKALDEMTRLRAFIQVDYNFLLQERDISDPRVKLN